MQITLRMSDDHMPEERIQDLTRELCLDLDRDPKVDATLEEGQPQDGARSEAAFTIGGILVTLGFHTAGAIAAHALTDAASHIAHKLAVYFQRNPSLRMEVALPDGRSLSLVESNVHPDKMEDTVVRLKELLEAAK